MSALARTTTAGLTAALALLLLLVAFESSAHAAQCKRASVSPAKLSKQRAERAVLCLINRQRASRGMQRLKLRPAADKAARKHTRVMVRRRCFAHLCSGEKDLVGRMSQSNYLPCDCYWGVAENLAYGASRYGSPRQVFEAWMDSSGHRKNILNRRFEHIGIAIVWGTPSSGRGRDAATYTTDFGYRE